MSTSSRNRQLASQLMVKVALTPALEAASRQAIVRIKAAGLPTIDATSLLAPRDRFTDIKRALVQTLSNPKTRYWAGAAGGAGGGVLAGALIDRLRSRRGEREGASDWKHNALLGATLGSGGLAAADTLAPAAPLMNYLKQQRPGWLKQADFAETTQKVTDAATKGVGAAHDAIGRAVAKVHAGLSDPTTRTQYAAGLGAAAGGVAGLASEAAGGKKRRRKSYIGSALTGAASGAALGGAAGYLHKEFAGSPSFWKSPAKPIENEAFQKFVSQLPTDPKARAVALKEYANRPETASWADYLISSGGDFAANHPLATAAGAAGVGMAGVNKAVDLRQSIQPRAQGAEPSPIREFIRSKLPNKLKPLTDFQLGDSHRLGPDFNQTARDEIKKIDPSLTKERKRVHGSGKSKVTETKPSTLDELLQNSGAREKLRRGAVDHPDVTGTLRLGPDETHTAAQIQSALNRAGKQKPRPSFRRQAGGALGVAGGLAAAGSVLQALMSRGHNAGND